MKRRLVLVLVLVLLVAPLRAGGGWDLTKPANDGYIASFPTEVRANQAAIVASMTPPIEWTGEETAYGRPSTKQGFSGYSPLSGGYTFPAHWLGSIGESVTYIFGPREEIPTEASGWYVTVASFPYTGLLGGCYISIKTPTRDGSGEASFYIDSNVFNFSDRRLISIATGTAAQDAVNLGQMSAAVDSVQVIAQSAPNTPVSEVLDEFYYVTDGAGIGMLATFSYEMVDTHGAWSGATFTAPLDGVYEITVSMLGYNSEESPSWTRIRTDNLGGTEVASAPFFLAYEQMTSYDYFMLTGTNYIPMDQGNTFCVFIQTSGTNVFTVARDSRIIRIRKIADLP
jgi:hypothetical protein